jgi:hypothetical protein
MPTRQPLVRAQTLRELRDREVVRTFNNPIGDIAEAIVALHYNGERGSFPQLPGRSRAEEASCFRSRLYTAPEQRPVEICRQCARTGTTR